MGTMTLGNSVTGGAITYDTGSITIDPRAIGDDTGELIIKGDLTVQGTTTTVKSIEVEIGDSTFRLNKDAAGPSNDGGIEVWRGDPADPNNYTAEFLWNESLKRWTTGSNQGMAVHDLTVTGNTTFSGTMSTTENMAVGNNNVFTVDANTGNTVVQGELRVAENTNNVLTSVSGLNIISSICTVTDNFITNFYSRNGYTLDDKNSDLNSKPDGFYQIMCQSPWQSSSDEDLSTTDTFPSGMMIVEKRNWGSNSSEFKVLQHYQSSWYTDENNEYANNSNHRGHP